jgi:xylulokinase
LAAVGAGAFKHIEEACEATIHIVKETPARRAATKYYDTGFRIYQDLYKSLKHDFKQIAALEKWAADGGATTAAAG